MMKRVFILFLFLCFNLNAQSLMIGTPTLNASQVCASPSSNNYLLTFSFIGVQLPGNQFIAELSDANGSFANPYPLKTITSTISLIKDVPISFPPNVYGTGYQIRIRSTNPVVIQIATQYSSSFSAYYTAYNQPFSINNSSGTARICQGQPITLAVDPGSNSPLQYPQLTYRWYKDNIVIPGENKPVFNTSQTGTYYVEIDYGSCPSSYAHSQFVNVVNTALTPAIQTTDQTNQLCDGISKQIVCSEQNPNFIYKWYKDGVLISGASTYTYDALQAGTYKVVVSDGGCDFSSNNLTLSSQPISTSITPLASNTIIPGQNIILNTVTNAAQPSYTWERNSNPLSGQTNSALSITQSGTYKVTVKQNQGCQAQQSAETTVVYPTGFDLAIKNTTPYTACQSTSAALVIEKFSALTPGPINILNNSYGYSYQWYNDSGAVSGATSIALNLTTALNNGSYKLGVTIPDFGEIFSNAIDVQLKITEDITITNNVPLCKNGDSVVLQSKLTNPNYSYHWYLNGTKIATNSTGNYTVTQAGIYYLIVRSGSCSLQSNTITLQEGAFGVNISAETPFVVPGQTMSLTVNTDAFQPTYAWYKNGGVITGENSKTLKVNAVGTYKVIVGQTGGCLIEKSFEISIGYPSGFTATIATDSGYQDCKSISTTLQLSKLIANSALGNVDLTANPYNYTFQWYKNGTAVSGKIAATLNLNNALDNGSYKLGVTIPDFGEIFSNTIDVQLKITEDITIANNVPLCKNGDAVVLQSKLTSPNYTYEWYFNGTKIATNTTGSYTVTQAGNYYLIVRSGSCSLQSNTIILQEGNFNVNISAETPLLVPGQTMTLTVNTDAFQPTYTWYKNGGVLTGENSNTLKINAIGTYKVVVDQTGGCLIEKSFEISIGYPFGFTATIVTDSGYQDCKNISTALKLSNLIANSVLGNVDLSANPYNYAFQWYKNSTAVSGEITTTLNLNNALDNGTYKLGVTIPDFGEIFSNTTDVQLKITEDITITNDVPLCKNGDSIVLQSKLTNPNYTYEWYFNGTKIATNTTGSYTVTQAGNYYLIVRSGSCSLQSNTISLKEVIFGVNISPEAPYILPGQTMTLTVNTDAFQPTYAWYKNGGVLTGENSNTLKINGIGVYKVVVSQIKGCLVEKSSEISIGYPSGFTVIIGTDSGYQDCKNISTTLKFSKLIANSVLGNLDLTTNPYQYTFQWYKDNVMIPGAVNSSLPVSDYSQNADYKLQVIIPDFPNVYSNTLKVLLGFATSLTITQTGVFCDNGSEVTLTSNYTDPAFTYEWFESSGNNVIGSENSIIVNKSGNYYLRVSQRGCSLSSNIISIVPYDFSGVTFDAPEKFGITKGSERVITATGADSYQWYFNDKLISKSNCKVTEEGTYTLIAKIGECEKTFIFEVTYHENKFVVSNTVTPNGDGFNDYWSIPLEYAYRDSILVTIYDSAGNTVYRTTNYENNWPQGSFQFSPTSPVFYFTIEKVAGGILKDGSITIIK